MKNMAVWGLAALCIPLVLCGATSLNVCAFGAAGNGIVDDYTAIQKALAELRQRTDAELFFPPGCYRIGTVADAAIDLSGAQRVGVRFASGAVLLMDNRKGLGKAAGHAIQVLGPASDIFFDGVNVEWKNPPGVRGSGDAFHIDAGTEKISGLLLSDCRASQVPGSGVFLGGVDDLKLRSVTVADSRGEGVVLDGCENVTLFKLTVQRSRGDALSMVPGKALPPDRTWSNCNISITQAEISDGEGAGIRLGGVENLETEFVTVSGKQIGVSVESGNDLPVPWNPPSQICLGGLEVENCSTGVALVCRTPGVAAFRRFDVKMDNCRLNGNGNDNLYVSGVDGLVISRLRANSGRIRMSDFHALTVQDLRVRTGYWVLSEVSGAVETRSRIANVTLDRACLTLENIDGIDWNGVTILDAPETALTLKMCRNVSFEDLRLTRPNRKNAENCRALWVDQCDTLTVSGLAVELDSRRVMPLDLSGGTLKIVGALKAPSEFYTPDTLLRLSSEPASDHPQMDLQITAVLGDKSFEL